MPETAGAYGIIAFATLIVVGGFYTVGWNSWERVSDAETDRLGADEKQLQTQVNVTEVVWDEGDVLLDGDEELRVFVNNTGSTTLSVNGSDLLIDGKHTNYSSSNVTTTVDGTDTDVWAPGQQLKVVVDDAVIRDLLNLDLTDSAKPAQIKFVAGPGDSEWERVP